LRKHGVKVRLHEQPFRVLVILLDRPGEMVSREDLRKVLWPNDTVVEFDHSINAAIKRLRDALGDSADNPRYVETLPRRGYRFIGEVETAPDIAPPVISDPDPDPGNLSGATFGHFRILEKLGSGGMGVVYRAEDLKLGRQVAVKFLSLPVAEASAQMRERFLREARAASALNHPNICTTHGVEAFAGQPMIVTELLVGETLAARLARGPLPLDQALALGIQVADALGEAHSKGIVHRDIKPANIMLTGPKGPGAKILDFGLARVQSAPAGDQSAMTATLTPQGTLVGTLHYMSPEQLEGKEADERSDIFSFGLVLYEMLTGKRAFQGASPASLISAIMTTEPAPIPTLQPPVPEALERFVRTCLAKAPDERWQSARDVKLHLLSMTEARAQVPPVAAVHARHRSRLWVAIAGVLLSTTALALFLHPSGTGRAEVTRFQVRAPENGAFASSISAGRIRVSPDGRSLAFVAHIAAGRDMIWIRGLDSFTARALPGTEGAAHIFWSWDSRFLAFFADGKLKRIEARAFPAPSPVQVVCDAPNGRAGSWGRSDVILFVQFLQGPLLRVPATGGTPVAATVLDANHGEHGHAWPSFLPDGRHFLFLARGTIFLSALDSNDRTPLLKADSNVDYAPPGYLLFVRDRALMAQPFDVTRLKLEGTEFPVEAHVGYTAVSGGNFSVSDNGVLVYGAGDDALTTQMVWYDRAGKRLSAIGEPGAYRQPQVSPDGSKAVVERLDLRGRASDIWLYDLARGGSSRLTFGPGWQYIPVVSGDMRRIAFSNLGKAADLVQKSTSGAGEAELLLSSAPWKYFSDWSHDGKFALFVQMDAGTGEDVWVLPVSGDRKPFPFLRTQFSEEQAQFSPDGKWIAYASDETGRPEVYVQSFPAAGVKLRISNNGGTQPRWRGDGKEIFYLGADRTMMSVNVNSGEHFEAATPNALFATRMDSELGPYMAFTYAVTADGKRFLLLDPVGDENSAIAVALNWTAGLSRAGNKD